MTDNNSLPTVTPTTSLARRVMVQAVILSAFIVVALTTLAFLVARSMIERSITNHLSSVAAVSEDAVEQALQSDRERASFLAIDPIVRAIALRQSDPANLDAVFAMTRANRWEVHGIAVVQSNGAVVATAGELFTIPQQTKNTAYRSPVVTEKGFTGIDVFVPIREGENVQGMLAIRFGVNQALASILGTAPAIGKTAQLRFSFVQDQELMIVHPSADAQHSFVLSLGDVHNRSNQTLAAFRSLNGEEGASQLIDESGHDVFAAYRYLPSLGWGMTLQVDREEALTTVRALSKTLSALGTLLLLFAGAVAWLLADQLTRPLRTLTDRVRELRPGNWNLDRTVHTRDEVEVLDDVVVDMAGRLKHVYEEQENLIEERTEDLREQFELDRAILQNIGYGVITVGRNGAITNINPAALNMLQREQKDIMGHAIKDVAQLCGHRGNILPDEHPVMQCLETGHIVRSPAKVHNNLRRADESLLPVMYAASPLKTNAEVFGAVIVLQDVTEERRVDYLKSEFITLASHQLRTPLSALRWYVELMEGESAQLTKDQQDYLKEMDNSVKRMVALLTALLHAANLEGDDLKPDIRKIDVTAIMRELNQDCFTMTSEAGLQCTLHQPEDAITIETDPTLLRIVLQNLLTNAVKYSPHHKGKKVEFCLEDRGNSVEMSVRDEGYGIPKNEQERVFQKFFRAANIRSHDTDGNGLGLFITRSIVERLGGIISFASIENKGTVFTVSFPKVMKKG